LPHFIIIIIIIIEFVALDRIQKYSKNNGKVKIQQELKRGDW